MPPKKRSTRLKPSQKILSSDSSSDQPSGGSISSKPKTNLHHQNDNEDDNLIELTRMDNREDIELFGLQPEQSPIKSPMKFTADLLLKTPRMFRQLQQNNDISAFEGQAAYGSSPGPVPTTTFFDKHRQYDFIHNKAERALFIFEILGKHQDPGVSPNPGPDPVQRYDPSKLISTLYQITNPHNLDQLTWIHDHIAAIEAFDNYDSFCQWLGNDVEYTTSTITTTTMTPNKAMVMRLVQSLVAIIWIGMKTMVLTWCSVVGMIYLLDTIFGIWDDEIIAYFNIIIYICCLILQKLFN